MRRALACSLLGLAWPAAAGAATGGQQALAILDRERAASGIPAALTLDPALSADCAAHDGYMAAHGLSHDETPGTGGYSPAGAYAARNSVLAAGAGWSAGDPYERAPLHLDQLLAPRLQRIGSADLDGFTCTTTFPGWTRSDPPAPVVYTVPGPGGTVGASELAAEQPFTAPELAGLAGSTRTGPVLIVLADAPGQSPTDNPASLSGATLAGPDGPVAVRAVDGTTAVPGGGTLAPYIAPGGFLIPVRPLVGRGRYHAHVVVGFAGARIPADWNFTATGLDPRSNLTLNGAALAFSSASPAAVQVAFARRGGGQAPPLRIPRGASVALRLPPGRWRACAHQAPRGEFRGYDGCIELTITGVPQLSLGSGRVIHGRVVFALRASRVLRGRLATLTVALTRGAAVLRTRTSHLRLRRAALTEPLPARGDGLRLTLTVPAFTREFTPWSATSTTARWTRR